MAVYMGVTQLKLGSGEHLFFEKYPITLLILTISLTTLKTMGVQNTCLKYLYYLTQS